MAEMRHKIESGTDLSLWHLWGRDPICAGD